MTYFIKNTLKRISLFICIYLFLSIVIIDIANSEVPPYFNYQGMISNSDSSAVNGMVNITFTIYDAPIGGNNLWSEQHSNYDVIDGFLSLNVGSADTVSNKIPLNVLQAFPRYLGITIGGDAELTPRVQLVSVPYSFSTGSIDNAEGGTINGSLIIVGSANDSIVINTTDSLNLYFTDSSGNTRIEFTISDDNSSLSFYDPVDFIPGFNEMSSGNKKMTLGPNGVTIFGASPSDTNLHFSPLGRIKGKGQIIMGENSEGNEFATVFGDNNIARDSSVISGGINNSAYGFLSNIGGGKDNVIDSSGTASTIGGGLSHYISEDLSVIGGGRSDTITARGGTIAGGLSNTITADYSTIGGGRFNRINAEHATVSGGFTNEANGDYSVVIGGRGNTANSNYSIVAGAFSKALNPGSVVIAANDAPTSDDSTYSTGVGQMVFRANGGMYITNSGGGATYDTTKLINTVGGTYLLTSGGAWQTSSDRNSKENIQNFDSNELLSKIESLDITKWNYINDNNDIPHIGPMAQDFYEVYGIGVDSLTISTLDLSGIALASIKELYKQKKELESKIDSQTKILENQAKQIEKLQIQIEMILNK